MGRCDAVDCEAKKQRANMRNILDRLLTCVIGLRSKSGFYGSLHKLGKFQVNHAYRHDLELWTGTSLFFNVTGLRILSSTSL